MKKFVGNVNGKNFDNEAEFLKAAEAAMKNGEDNFSISSYYRYSSTKADNETEEQKEQVDDPNFVSAHEYFLGGRTPDVDANGGYTVSKELEKRILGASNRDDIKKCVGFHIGKLENNIKEQETHLKYILEGINDLQKRVDDNKKIADEDRSSLNDLNSRLKYYNTLYNLIKAQEDVEKEQKKEQEEVNEGGPSDKEFNLKEKIQEEVKKKPAASLLEMSALDFLKQLGFIK